MRRMTIVILAAMVLALAAVAPVAGKEFGRLYANGEVYRTSAIPPVTSGTGRDPIATFETRQSPTALGRGGVAGNSTHGRRWAVHHATFLAGANANTLVTSWAEPMDLVGDGQIMLVHDEAADFRCPIIPNG